MLASLTKNWHRPDRNVLLHYINVGSYTLTLDGGIYTVILNLYMLRLGFNAAEVGAVNAAGMLAFALASLPVGGLGERWGYRRMITVGTVMAIVGALLVVGAEVAPRAAQVPIMIAAIVVVYVGMASFFVNMVPYMVAFTDDRTRTTAFAAQSAVGGSFAFVGSLIGGSLPVLMAALTGATLQSSVPFALTLLLAPLLLCIPLRISFIQRDPPPHPEPEPPGTLARDEALPSVARSFFWLIAFFAIVRALQVALPGSTTTFFNVYMDTDLQAGTADIGAIQAATRLLTIPVALLIPTLSRRFGVVGVSVAASLLTAACAIPIALAPTWVVAGLGFIVAGVATTLRYNTFMIFSMERTPPQLRGSCNGAQEMLAGLSFALAALVGGTLIAPLGFDFVFLGTAAITVLGTLIFWVYARRTSPKQTDRLHGHV